MTSHDGSTNTHAFASPEHATVTGAVYMALALKEAAMGWRVEPGLTSNDDFLPYVMVAAGRKRFQVLITEVES